MIWIDTWNMTSTLANSRNWEKDMSNSYRKKSVVKRKTRDSDKSKLVVRNAKALGVAK